MTEVIGSAKRAAKQQLLRKVARREEGPVLVGTRPILTAVDQGLVISAARRLLMGLPMAYQAGNTCRARKNGLSFARHCSLMLNASVTIALTRGNGDRATSRLTQGRHLHAGWLVNALGAKMSVERELNQPVRRTARHL